MDRSLLPEGAVTALARAIPIEFAVIHASGFLAWPWVARWPAPKRQLFVPALAAAYTVPLAVVAVVVHGWWPLAIFWGLMLNRMLVVLLGDRPDERAFDAWAMAWAGTTTLFVLGVCVAALGGSTLGTKALLVGSVYFTLVALSEITTWAWVRRWMARARPGR